MPKRPPRSRIPESRAEATIAVSRLRTDADGWLLAGDIAQHFARTLDNRRRLLRQLF